MMKRLILYILLLLFITYPVYAQVRPSYYQGFVKHGSLSKRPNLWKGIVGIWKPSLGVTGLGTDAIKDISAFKNHGITNGSMTMADWVISGNRKLPGYVLDLDGSDDQLNFGSASILDDIFVGGGTILAWVKSDEAGGLNLPRIFNKRIESGNFDGWTTQIRDADNRKIALEYSFSNFPLWDTDIGITYGEWFHVAISYDDTSTGNDPKIYINGVSRTLSESEVPSGSATSDAGNDLLLGGRESGISRNLNGKIDDMRVYNRILTDAEIIDIFQHPNAMFEPRDIILVKAPVAAARRIIMISQTVNRWINGIN